MKTQKELNELKEEIKTLNAKLAELNEEELEQVSGGRKKPTERPKKKEPAKKHGFKGIEPCPRCNAPKLPYRVCPNCGYDDARGEDSVESSQD